ncbi:MAG: DUF3784 domain-containing protein [Ruminococcaceae bacterium]|nr:DUF3784 domain-containing protein [Oscillospiraceae bacterium]
MTRIICAIICGIFALIALIISIRSFKEKGFLFNNAYIWASKQEREQMNKKPHYRQTAIVFALLAAAFICMTIETVLATGWLWIGTVTICIAVIVYAIASSVKNELK